MALQIIKENGQNVWTHKDTTGALKDLQLSAGFFRTVGTTYELFSNNGGMLRTAVLSDIEIIDRTDGDATNTYTTQLEFNTRLKELAYPFFSDASDGSGAIQSVFGRTDAHITAVTGDYDASQVTNDSTVAGATVADALDTLSGATGATELSDLTDVSSSTPTNRNVLVANGTLWESRALVMSDISDLPTIPAELSDLTDVNTSTPTNRNVLVADGVDWESRALVVADISDFPSVPTQLSDLSDVGSVAYTNRHVLIADGTDYDSRLLVEADISDLGSYVDGSGAANQVVYWQDADTVQGNTAWTFDGNLMTFGAINTVVTFNDTTGIIHIEGQNQVEIEANTGIRLIPLGTAFYHDITSGATSSGLTAQFQNSSGVIAWVDDIPTVDDTAYGASWDGNQDAATKNAIYDKIETLDKDVLVENAAVTGTYDLDYNNDTWLLTLTGVTTFTESNLPTSGTNTKTISLYVTGDFALTFPANWSDDIIGTYDGTVMNQIIVEYIKSGEYFVTINQPD